jgi:hypothetical protein
MKSLILSVVAALLAVGSLAAQVPQILNYQGKVTVGTAPFSGVGQFRFALVNADGTTSHWSNDGTSTAGSEPTAAVSLPVVNGLYIVPLGDTAIGNMATIPANVFANSDVRVRVWFNDGTHGSELLAPDQRLTSVAYAMVAGTVPDSSITAAKLAPSAKPKVDRQATSIPDATTIVVNGFPNYTDLPGMTLTTKSLGEAGTYTVHFRTTTSTNAVIPYVVTVNGNPVPASEVRGGTGNGWSPVSLHCVLTGLNAGSVIKVSSTVTGAPLGVTIANSQLVIDGVPSSTVVP